MSPHSEELLRIATEALVWKMECDNAEPFENAA